MTPRRQFLRACAVAGAGAIPARALFAAASQGVAVDPSSPAWAARHFPAVSAADQGFIYLDSAATTHRAQAVIDAITRFYVEDNANPARVHARARRAAATLGDARTAVAKFLKAADPLEVVFTRGTTEAVNLAAQSWGSAHLRAGDEVVLTTLEHASNLMPWVRVANATGARIRILEVDDSGQLRLDTLGDVLTSRTKLVAVSHASNVLGIINPVKQIAQAAKAVGARTFVDGAQGAPHVAIDVQDLGCDFYAFSGHKLCGPMGAGALWARRDVLDSMLPYHVGSNMAHGVEFDRTAEFEAGALRFQAGTPDVAAAAGLAAAVRFLDNIGRSAVWSHDQALVKAARGLTRIKTLRLLGDLSHPLRIPVFSFVLEGRTVPAIVDALDRRGIGVRGGDLAALPLLKRFGTAEAARASAYLYSSPAQIERLIEALQDVAIGKLARRRVYSVDGVPRPHTSCSPPGRAVSLSPDRAADLVCVVARQAVSGRDDGLAYTVVRGSMAGDSPERLAAIVVGPDDARRLDDAEKIAFGELRSRHQSGDDFSAIVVGLNRRQELQNAVDFGRRRRVIPDEDAEDLGGVVIALDAADGFDEGLLDAAGIGPVATSVLRNSAA